MRRFLTIALWVVASCSGGNPSALGPPDPTRIVLFFPIDGVVYGLGDAGAAPPGASHVVIQPRPGLNRIEAPVAPDGSFRFEVRAPADQVLEFAGTTTQDGAARGPAIFMRVPFARVFEEDFRCCLGGAGRVGRCVRASEENPICAEDPLYRCERDADCMVHAQRTISLGPETIRVSSPDPSGEVQITGAALPPFALVLVGTGGTQRTAMVTSESGHFEMTLRARGGHELGFEVYGEDGQRSPRHAVRVPNAEIAGLELRTVESYGPLFAGRRGGFAMRVRVAGVDGFGLCPPSAVLPLLCRGGGLDFDTFELSSMTMDGVEVATAPRLDDRYTEGDPLSGPSTTLLMIDTGPIARRNDPEGHRFESARNFVRALGIRNRLGIVELGGGGTTVVPTTGRESLQSAINLMALARQEVEADYYAGIDAAITMLSGPDGVGTRRLVLIASGVPAPADPRHEATLRKLLSAARPSGYPLHVLGLGLSGSGGGQALTDLGTFSGGHVVSVAGPGAYRDASRTFLGHLTGGFMLLYDIDIPLGLSGEAAVRLEATITLPGTPGEPRRTTNGAFTGTMMIEDALN